MSIDVPDYAIVIPAFDEQHYLQATLRSVRESMQAVREWHGELIVVDNASTDDTAGIALRGGAQLVFEPERGIARARNAGAARVQARWLVFVDADTRITPALLQQTLAELASGRACGGGTVVRLDRDHFVHRTCARVWNALARRLGWACGAYIFCTAEAFRAVGGFDESLYATEELVLSRVVRNWGRQRGQRWVLLREPILTSARKTEWFTPREILTMCLRFALRPALVRDREACAFWYARPPSGTRGPSG